MKKLFSTFVTLLSAALLSAQTPDAFNYQAVARDNSGLVLVNQAISLRLTVHDVTSGGTAIYSERQTATTNQFGLFSIQIGQGTVLGGTFSAISWGSANKYLQVEFDPLGGTAYADMGTTQLISVPYAKVAEVALNSPWALNGNNINNTNSGHVYIGGTPNLDGGLVVRGNSGLNSAIGIEDATTNMHWSMEVEGNDFYFTKGSGNTFSPIHLYNTGEIQFLNTVGRSDVLINDSGNVGIGTISPLYPLHIATSFEPAIQIDGSGASFSGIEVNATNNSAKPYYGYEVGGNIKAYTYSDSSGNWFLSNNGFSNSIAIAALANGYIGIGTVTPASTLDVEGSWASGSNLGLVTVHNNGTGPAITAVGLGTLTGSGAAIRGLNTNGGTGVEAEANGAGWALFGYNPSSTGAAGNFTGNIYVNQGKIGIGTFAADGALTIVNNASGLTGASIHTSNANAAGIGIYCTTNSTDATAVFTNAYGSAGNPAIMAKFFDGGASDIVRIDNYDGANYGRISMLGGNAGNNNGGYIYGSAVYGAVIGDITGGTYDQLVNAYHPTVSTTAFSPWSDNTTSCGDATYRWSAVYAANGTIQTSDERLKENIKPIEHGLNDLMNLKPVSYQWIDKKSRMGNGNNLGFIAQDLEKILPEVVVHSQISQEEITKAKKEKGIDITNTDTYGVKYSEIIPVLVRSIQEQEAKIDAQQAEIEALKLQVKYAHK